MLHHIVQNLTKNQLDSPKRIHVYTTLKQAHPRLRQDMPHVVRAASKGKAEAPAYTWFDVLLHPKAQLVPLTVSWISKT